ncbi:MAG: protein kinase [Rhabdochlamydiaceae bacterium]|nr:protein kinase [Candidatus Amphrikana amoebophyrae]
MKDHLFYDQPTLPTAAAQTQDSIPKRVGPYAIESLLSHGGMSSLYLGKEVQTKKVVAIKVLSPSFVQNQEMIAQFLEEAKIISIADHTNIIKLYGQGKWQHGLYIAMEFVQGVSLRQFIDQHSLSLKRSLNITLQVCHALLHLHTHDIIHRDLKPENILITESGQVKVVDFGVAQLRDSEAGHKMGGGTIGTPSYMAPEQVANPLNATYASDIFSLGIILYEMVIGKLSYGHIQLSLVPKNLRPIIAKAIAPSLKDRYEDVVDLITAISLYSKESLSIDETQQGAAHSEILDSLLSAQKHFTTLSLPDWDQIDIGLASFQNGEPLGVTHDFIKLPNGNRLILTAESLSGQVDAALYIAYLKGMLKPMVAKYEQNSNITFNIDRFATELNTTLCQDKDSAKFKLNILFLNPSDDQYTFLSCGYHSLWHSTPQTAVPKLITHDNPILGLEKSQNFSHTNDNWYGDDILIFHTFNDSRLPAEKQLLIEKKAKEVIVKNLNMALPALCKLTFDELISHIDPSLSKEKRSVIAVQRL